MQAAEALHAEGPAIDDRLIRRHWGTGESESHSAIASLGVADEQVGLATILGPTDVLILVVRAEHLDLVGMSQP